MDNLLLGVKVNARLSSSGPLVHELTIVIDLQRVFCCLVFLAKSYVIFIVKVYTKPVNNAFRALRLASCNVFA